jgi:hypothetical protein
MTPPFHRAAFSHPAPGCCLTGHFCLALEARHILMVSLSLRGHITPLSRLATELVTRGHKVSFAVHDDGRDYLNKTGVRCLSMGRPPLTHHEREEKLRQVFGTSIRALASCLQLNCAGCLWLGVQISYDGFFRGLLSLLNDVYLPYTVPTYKALNDIVRKYVCASNASGVVCVMFCTPFLGSNHLSVSVCLVIPERRLKLENGGRGGPDLMVIDIGALGAIDVAQVHHIPYVINNPSLLVRLDNSPHYVPGLCAPLFCSDSSLSLDAQLRSAQLNRYCMCCMCICVFIVCYCVV